VSSRNLKTAESIAGYTIQERIGAGGYGEVWKAEAPGGLHKAIKFVYGFLDEERAARELKALNRIKEVRHPFLLSLDRIEIIDSQLVIVTELADGSLKDRFQECREAGQPGIPRDELLVYLGDAADALDHMSENYSLQHLDVKPENLLIVGKRVKVADFGLVKDIHDTSMSLMGGLTPLYSPPEVFDGQPSLHSDQYSLAIVYQEMLTGVLPFPGRTASQLAAQHLHARPRLGALPIPDRAILARALAKNPDERFANCRALVESLLDPHARKHRGEGDPASDTTSVAANATEPAQGTPRERPATRTQPVDDPSALVGTDSDPGGISRFRSQLASESLAEFDWAPPESPPEVVALPPIELEAEACGFRPTLVIGIGGTAAKTLRQLRRRFGERFGSVESIPSVSMLLLETDPNSIAEVTRSDHAGALDAAEILATPLRSPQQYRTQSRDLMQWLSRRWLYNIPRSLRTEGVRPLGRLALAHHGLEFLGRLREALAAITASEALAHSSNATGLNVRTRVPRVFVVASISGGTGGGMVLDVGYAVRKVLADLGISSEGVCGILTHSPGRTPRETDLACANAYACLSELAHYGGPGHYPGDPALGLPAFPPGTPPFEDTYLLPFGGSDAAAFLAAVDSLAEYLYLDVVTRAGAFFDRCRAAARAGGGPAAMRLRTFGIGRLGDTLDDLPSKATERLAKSVVARWRGDGLREPLVPKSQKSEAESSADSDEALLDRPAVGELARQRADDWKLSLEHLIEQIVQLAGAQWGEDANAHLAGLIHAAVPGDGGRARAKDPGAQAAAALEEVDRLLGPRDLPDDALEIPPECLRAGLERPLDSHCRALKAEMSRWMLDLANSPRGSLKAVQYAADWCAEHLRAMELEARDLAQHLDKQLPQWEESLRRGESDGAARRRGWLRLRRDEEHRQFEAKWSEYCRLRLYRLALGLVPQLTRSLKTPVTTATDLTGQLQRELRLVGDAFREPAACEVPPAREGPPSDTFDRLRRLVTERLHRQMPVWTGHLAHEFRTDFFGRKGLWSLLEDEADLRHALPGALRRAAHRAVLDMLAQFDLEALLFTPHGNEPPGEWVKKYLQKSTPDLAVCGGAKRLLLMLPQGASLDRLRETVRAHVAEPPSIAGDFDFDVVFCWEMEQIPPETAAATLIDYRPDYAQLGARLHTRIDVAWTPLGPSGADGAGDSR